jgi:pimeloyl-ACP methyl ester carboxylesterase
MRFYKDNAGAQLPAPLDRTPLIPVPTAFGIAPKDVVMMPRARAEAATDLCRWAIFERGGHFGPSEIPEVLVDEYRAFFREL